MNRCSGRSWCVTGFFVNDTATTEIYTLSLHDALPISQAGFPSGQGSRLHPASGAQARGAPSGRSRNLGLLQYRSERSEEHTSELQSRQYLVCRLLLEKTRRLSKCSLFGSPPIRISVFP